MAIVDVFSLVASVVIAATLLFAAGSKLRNLPEFAHGLRGYGLLPTEAVPWIARLLPIAEVVLAMALLFGWAEPWPALAAAGLFAVFCVAIAVAVHRGRDISCRCFGPSPKHRVGFGAFLRALVLLALALIAAYGQTNGTSEARVPLPLWSTEQILALLAAIQLMALTVVLAEPVVLLVRVVRAARLRVPALRAAERSRRSRTCGSKPVVDVEGAA